MSIDGHIRRRHFGNSKPGVNFPLVPISIFPLRTKIRKLLCKFLPHLNHCLLWLALPNYTSMKILFWRCSKQGQKGSSEEKEEHKV